MELKIIKELILWIGLFCIIISIRINDGGILTIFFYLLTLLFYYGIKYFYECIGKEIE